MRHQYSLPFGANFLPNGQVSFTVWAPGVQSASVKLLRPQGNLFLPMTRNEKGWFHVTTAEAQAGSLYYYDFGDGKDYPDPASRRQPEGIEGPSEIIDPAAYEWHDAGWRGRPWCEASIYELHVGTFTEHGNYGGIERQLDYLQKLGITAIEIMPIAQGPGTRSWGYDGVYLYAPETSYGTPDDLKRLIEMAHNRGIMVFLDVVYNHFGPEGNYLGVYAPQFFTDRHKTPWGTAINFDQAESEAVREFYWHNALYWLEEYRFDGLRCDAVHAIVDDSEVHIFEEIAIRVDALAKREDRHIHMIAENENNVAHLLERDDTGRPKRFTAQWNDDFHHNMHVILTGETDAYFVDYAPKAHELLARCLAEGFAYQGEPSVFRNGRTRGENSKGIPANAFINFLQNHDQAGNRPMGERVIVLTEEAPLKAAIAVQLLNPAPPMIFMGEEWGATQPFPYFCDFGPELSHIIHESRIKEFAIGDKFKDDKALQMIPDPTAPSTFESAVLDWSVTGIEPHHMWLAYYRKLLTLRSIEIAPLMDNLAATSGVFEVRDTVIFVAWPIKQNNRLLMEANLGAEAKPPIDGPSPDRSIIFATHPSHLQGDMQPWSVVVSLDRLS